MGLIALALAVGLALCALIAAGALYRLPQVANRREVARNRAALAAIGAAIPILMPVCDRPQYLARVLAGLREVEGIDETVLIFSQDERNPEVRRLIADCGLKHVYLAHTQPFFALLARSGLLTRIHCTASNVFFLLDTAFAATEAPGVIVLEDDLVPGPNFYRFFQWCFAHVLLDDTLGPRTLACGAYHRFSKGQIPFEARHTLFRNVRYFSPWGWAISRERFAQIRGSWSFTSWDSGMERTIMPKFGLVTWLPLLSHVECIGNHGINGGRADDCTFYTTARVSQRIDFAERPPALLPDGAPRALIAPYLDVQRVEDPAYVSEYDRKLVPWLWARAQRLLASDTLARWKRRLPFL